MSAIPEVVADPTASETLSTNIEPEFTTGDHFEPLFCLDFEHQINLQPNVDRNNPSGMSQADIKDMEKL